MEKLGKFVLAFATSWTPAPEATVNVLPQVQATAQYTRYNVHVQGKEQQSKIIKAWGGECHNDEQQAC